MAKFLVILESPGKVKKVSSILGSGYKVVASVGHFRKLADSGEDSTGVSLKDKPPRVKCDYSLINGSGKIVKSLQQAVNQAEKVFIATDPDREGECIAWHLIEALKWKFPPLRISFSEITEKAVREAMANPHPLDENLVASARARDCLDKIVGYRLSPLLWEMNKGAKSAGRCQSAALRLLCRLESQIQRFVPQNFWKIQVRYGEGISATYTTEDGSTRIEDPQTAKALAEKAAKASHQVKSITRREIEKSPPPAFKTSTLQQEAGSILGLSSSAQLTASSSEVMRLAQNLYERGHITYHRTDSVVLSPEFVSAVREWLQDNDPENLPEVLTQRRDKAGTQAGHEAIRPVDVCIETIPGEGNSLYQLIRNRAIASLCNRAILEQTELVIAAADLQFETVGKQILFPGYGKYWHNLGTDNLLPHLEEGQRLAFETISTPKGQTPPPSRLSEPRLVQVLEQEGVGRPSTFASIIATLLDRGYVRKVKGKLTPTPLGKEVDQFLQRVVPQLIDPGFTRKMELSLDAIANGSLPWQQYLVGWHDKDFQPVLSKGQQIIQKDYALPADEEVDSNCHYCGHSGLIKRYSNSPKLDTNHYLLCPECESPHFWNSESSDYQLPYNLRLAAEVKEEDLTDYRCPVCDNRLERHEYKKQGQVKQMLRCWKRLKSRCANVAYFPSNYGGWWSPKFGDLAEEGAADFRDLV